MKVTTGYLSATALLVFALGLACAPVRADTIIPTGVDSNRGRSDVRIVENGVEQDAYFVGVINIAITDNNNITYLRDSMCVDLFTIIYITQQYNTTVLRPDQEQPKNGPRVSWLIDNALLPTYHISGYTSQLDPIYWVDDPSSGAALQLAIWDIVHDGGDGFAAGSVQYGSRATLPIPAVLSAANYYLAASQNNSSDLAYVYRNIIIGSTPPTEAQMLIGPLYEDSGPNPNPEPATLALAGGVLIALGAVARRKKRTSSAN